MHRCRFVAWSPSPITALAVPPHGSVFPPLAVGRQNGDIELYRWAASGPSPQAWVLHSTLPGPADTKVDALAFTIRARRQPGSRLRLFSLPGDANIFEWDIHSGTVRHTIPSQGGTVWSLAPNSAGTLLAIGCQDGAVRLLDISVPDAPIHLKRFDRVQTRFLSIAWAWSEPATNVPKSSDPASESDSDDEADSTLGADLPDTTLVTGCSDSCLRTWDIRTGRVVNRMTVERARGERTLVWSVAVLGDGTIVSGDSLGTVKFWDNNTATQIHSFPAHNADVLCMTISPTGDTVYTSGVDQRTTEFVKLAPSNSADPGKWVQTTQRRIHSHDVRALAMWPPYAPHTRTASAVYAPLLISAGLDMSVAILPTTPAQPESSLPSQVTNPLLGSNAPTFEDAFPKRVGYPVSAGNVVLAPRARLVSSFSGRVVGVWRLPEDGEGEWEKLLEMELRFRTNITAGAVSPDGKWLAAADAWEVKLFRLEDAKGTLRPRRSRTIAQVLSAPEATGASALGFTPDSRRLVVATWTGSRVVLLDLDEHQEEVVRVFDVRDVGRESEQSGANNQDNAHADNEDENAQDWNADAALSPRISRVAVSPDSQWLASADSAGHVCVFNLDSVKHVSTLPRTTLPPSALAFDSRIPHVLAIGFPNNELQLFDAEAQLFYPALPDKLSHLHDPILGIVFPHAPKTNERKMYVWSATWLARFDVPTPSSSALVKTPPRPESSPTADRAPLKRKRGKAAAQAEGEADEAFAIENKFRPVLLVDFCAPVDGEENAQGEMVIVERPLVDLLATLPPAYLKPKYGAS